MEELILVRTAVRKASVFFDDLYKMFDNFGKHANKGNKGTTEQQLLKLTELMNKGSGNPIIQQHLNNGMMGVKKKSQKRLKSEIPLPPGVNKPASSYMLYNKMRMPELKKALTGKTVGEVAKMIGEEWSKKTDAEKQPYVDEYIKTKKIYDDFMLTQGFKPYIAPPPRAESNHEESKIVDNPVPINQVKHEQYQQHEQYEQHQQHEQPQQNIQQPQAYAQQQVNQPQTYQPQPQQTYQPQPTTPTAPLLQNEYHQCPVEDTGITLGDTSFTNQLDPATLANLTEINMDSETSAYSGPAAADAPNSLGLH